MTVVAAVAVAGRVTMGCDTATDHNGTTVYRSDGKVSRILVGDEVVLVGSAGNSGIRSVLRRHWKLGGVPEPSVTDIEADTWADACAEAITDVLASTTPPLLLRQDHNADTLDGCLLLAWRQHLWIIHTHSALRPQSGAAAIGSGGELALGSLLTAAHFDADPQVSMDYAIRTACTHDSGCGIDVRGPLIYTTS